MRVRVVYLLYTSNILLPNLLQVGDTLPSVTVSLLATTSPTTGRRENQTASTTSSTAAQLAQEAPVVKQRAGTSKILGSKSVGYTTGPRAPADVETMHSHAGSAGKGGLERQNGGLASQNGGHARGVGGGVLWARRCSA